MDEYTRTVAYTSFGKTKAVPRKIYVGRKLCPECTEYEKTLWVERGEDWYGLSKEPTLVVEREDWLSADECEPESECARKYKKSYLMFKRRFEEAEKKVNLLQQEILAMKARESMKEDIYNRMFWKTSRDL